MKSKNIGRLLAAAVFVGCSADDGAAPPIAEGSGDPGVAAATAEQAGCPSITATLEQHALAGRAVKRVTTFFIFQITSYYAAKLSNQAAAEYLGADPNLRVTLYVEDQSQATWTADQNRCAVLPICGDGVRTGDELCEGTDVGTATCASLGFDGPSPLACTSGCLFDLDSCSSICGNGRRGPDEICDGAIQGDTSCVAWSSGEFVGGSIRCSSACEVDTSGCVTPVCGNGVREIAEECDGADLGGITTCNQKDPGYESGAVSCNAQCQYDITACVASCGNGVIDTNEQCDGSARSPEFAGKQCKDFKFPWPVWPWNVQVNYGSGSLTCNSCGISYDACKPAPGCYVVTGRPPIQGLVCY
jgi:hypothetical protein